jgi:hypothetical protein
MFKSFLPKIVQIPASALPIAMLGLFGYRSPEGGRVQNQPDSVSIYIRCVALVSFVVSCVAYLLKRRYPVQDGNLAELADSIEMHKKGEWARDPVSRRLYKPMCIQSDEEQEAFWLFNHFSPETLQSVFVDENMTLDENDHIERKRERFSIGCQQLVHLMKQQLFGALASLLVALIGSGISLPLLFDPHFQFMPTICVVFAGVATAATGFAALRLRAALKLANLVEEDAELDRKVTRLLNHQCDLARMGKTHRATSDFISSGRRAPTFNHRSVQLDESEAKLVATCSTVEEIVETLSLSPIDGDSLVAKKHRSLELRPSEHPGLGEPPQTNYNGDVEVLSLVHRQNTESEVTDSTTSQPSYN